MDPSGHIFRAIGNAIQKSIQSLTSIISGGIKSAVSNAADRYNRKFDSAYDFANYSLFGIPDVVRNTPQGMAASAGQRYTNMVGSGYAPEGIANWLTSGIYGMAKGAVAPEDPFSEEHWLNSFGTALVLFGGYRGVRNVRANAVSPYGRTTLTSSNRANDVIQYERLRAGYAADEILSYDRIGTALSKTDPGHRAASFLSRGQLATGRVTTFRSGDGVYRVLLQTKGSLNGTPGIYEYIITPDGYISHQRFIKGGIFTGFANQ